MGLDSTVRDRFAIDSEDKAGGSGKLHKDLINLGKHRLLFQTFVASGVFETSFDERFFATAMWVADRPHDLDTGVMRDVPVQVNVFPVQPGRFGNPKCLVVLRGGKGSENIAVLAPTKLVSEFEKLCFRKILGRAGLGSTQANRFAMTLFDRELKYTVIMIVAIILEDRRQET
jgi:hypothetical protein